MVREAPSRAAHSPVLAEETPTACLEMSLLPTLGFHQLDASGPSLRGWRAQPGRASPRSQGCYPDWGGPPAPLPRRASVCPRA